jgi:hypothetical protein
MDTINYNYLLHALETKISSRMNNVTVVQAEWHNPPSKIVHKDRNAVGNGMLDARTGLRLQLHWRKLSRQEEKNKVICCF